MTKRIPEVRIKYAWLLAGETSDAMNEKYGAGASLGSFEHFQGVAEKYRAWWTPQGGTILQGLCDILNLEFRQNIIDVYIAPWFNPISDPLVIGPAFSSEDSLLNAITHELIHRLLTDNTSSGYDHDFLSDWKKLFGDYHTWNTLVHIPVHAVMKKLYLDIIDRPDLFKLDMRETRDYAPYAEAWKFVNDGNYDEIVASLSLSKSS